LVVGLRLRLLVHVNGSNNPYIDMFTQKFFLHSAFIFLTGLFFTAGITAHAASASVATGQAATFSIAVNGTAPFTYQWYKNGAAIAGAISSTYQISSMQTANAGVYSALISNSAGSTTSDSATISLASAPVLTTQPVSQTATAGTSVTFTAGASGAPAPTYQWQKGGVNISGATGTSYVIASAAAGDASTYTVVATNSAGSVTSAGAVLTVNPVNTAPTISAIANQTTGPGAAVGPISFIVGDAQTAAGSLIVTGSSSNPTLLPAGNIVFGGSGANRTVTLTPVAGQTGTTTIMVTVSDGVLATSGTFNLSVSALATTTQTVSNVTALTIPDMGPASLYPATVNIGGMSGTISAVTLSFNGFSHTWASDVAVLLVSPAGQKILVMAGAGAGTTNATLTFSDSASLSLPQTSALVTGTYKPTSYATTTVVFPAPAPAAPYDTALAVLNGQPANGTWSLYVVDGYKNDSGSIAGGWTLNVTTTGATSSPPTISAITGQSTTTGTPTAAIPFVVGDADTPVNSLTMSGSSSNPGLVPAGNITFGGSGANRTVTIAPAAGLTGTATISVKVSDGTSTATNTFLLTVSTPLTAPVFTTQPVGKTVAAGSAVTFTSAASGLPVPTYQWRKNSVNIGGATGPAYTIASVAASDAGTYSVVATNSVGSATSAGAVLTVNSIPVITTQPASQTVIAGANVTFTVAASGTPTPTYQWRKSGVTISGATGTSYVIASAAASDAGTYTVVAANSAGSVTSTGAVLIVNPVNTAPTITTIANQTTIPGMAVGPISFIVGDAQTAAGSLILTGTSSNATLVPNGNFVFGGSGANRTVTFTPAVGQTGTTTITVTVSDGALTTSESFLLSVNSLAPTTQTVSNVAPLTIPDSGPATPYPSTVTIAGMNGTIRAVTLSLNGFSHTWASDVSVLLVSPTGQKILVMANAGTGTTNATLTFSDTATVSLPQTGALVTGTYKPTSYGMPPVAFPAPAPAAPYASPLAALTGQAANGTWSLYVMDGWRHDQGSIAGGWTLTVTTAPVVNWSDFNGDGKSDIIWQNGTTGEGSVWLMSGTTVGSVASLGTVFTGWRICGTGDFNNDGKTDILVQNVVTGACNVWLMNGTTVGSVVSLGNISANLILAGSGDFNGDGKSDILWQNSVTGECSVWLMAGTTVSSIVSLGTVSPNLMITGTGDFNKDGQSDILWQNTATGEYGVWLMTGVTVGSNVSLGTVSVDWQMSGAGDFNGDGQSDLLWQNLLTGECSVWLMSGTTVSSKVSLGTVSLDWILRN
jgi:subtilisin-like proprotein convertase family protein